MGPFKGKEKEKRIKKVSWDPFLSDAHWGFKIEAEDKSRYLKEKKKTSGKYRTVVSILDRRERPPNGLCERGTFDPLVITDSHS